MILGGKLSNVPKPWKFYFFDANQRPRQIEITSRVWRRFGFAIGANGHHHCDIKEENNMVWDVTLLNDPYQSNKNDLWRMTGVSSNNFSSSEYNLHKTYIAGRSTTNIDFIRKKDVVKWAVGVLQSWGVLKDKRYKIIWDLDDDDSYADETLAREMRKRAERND